MTQDGENVTQAQPLPPHETTASPVEVSVAMPRYFGITPPTLLFGIATATLVAPKLGINRVGGLVPLMFRHIIPLCAQWTHATEGTRCRKNIDYFSQSKTPQRPSR